MGVKYLTVKSKQWWSFGAKYRVIKKADSWVLSFSMITVRVGQEPVLAKIPGGSLLGLILLKQLPFHLGPEKATTIEHFTS